MAYIADQIKAESNGHLRFFNAFYDALSSQGTKNEKFLDEVVTTAPIFSLRAHIALTSKVKRQIPYEDYWNGHSSVRAFPQYGVLGSRLSDRTNNFDPSSLIYTNVSAPWSAFICGSQGSGKSHSLSCLLENSLVYPSPTGNLTSPLSGLVMHYDKFTSFASTQLCEAAYLCSSVPVRVLVSPTNEIAMRNAYLNMLGTTGNCIKVMPMYLPKKGLTMSMMKTLMGIDGKDTHPLYMDVVMKVLREIAIENQGCETFDYDTFKARIDKVDWVKGQAGPLYMRLEVLESFFAPPPKFNARGRKITLPNHTEDIWRFDPGTLTIIDLSCPFVGADDACAMFNILISLFLKDRGNTGRILALDEAHKFLGSASSEAVSLTDTLLSVVRQQRHLATRVVIATQEPTVSPKFLDLCNLTMIHRFTSPVWFQAIREHLAGAGVDKFKTGQAIDNDLFRRIVELKTGQALLFCPTGLVAKEMEAHGAEENNGSWKNIEDDGWGTPIHADGKSDVATPAVEQNLPAESQQVVQLGPGPMHIQVRNRITLDGGRSIIAK